jgi:hypothetical protein
MLSIVPWRVRAGMASGLLMFLICAPDALSQPPPGGTPGGNATPPTPGGNKPPSVSIVAIQLPNNAWRFQGTVSDEYPGGLTVRLSGVPGLSGTSAVTAADGSYSVTVILQPGVSGTVTATVTDREGETGSGSTYISG